MPGHPNEKTRNEICRNVKQTPVKKHLPNSAKKVQCRVCKIQLNKTSLARHIKNAHINNLKRRYSRHNFYSSSKTEMHRLELSKNCGTNNLLDKIQSNGKVFNVKEKCKICQITLTIKQLKLHSKQIHNLIFSCKIWNCASYFATEMEKQQHEAQAHIPPATVVKRKKCIYCNKMISILNDTSNLHRHIKHQHIDAIKCDYRCTEYFLTTTEKNKHILKVHKAERFGVKCVYCGIKMSTKQELYNHVRDTHAAISIKCRFWHCGFYFLNQTERDEHFRLEHRRRRVWKKFYVLSAVTELTKKNIWCGILKYIIARIEPQMELSGWAQEDLNKLQSTIHLYKGNLCWALIKWQQIQRSTLKRHFLWDLKRFKGCFCLLY